MLPDDVALDLLATVDGARFSQLIAECGDFDAGFFVNLVDRVLPLFFADFFQIGKEALDR